MAATPANPTGLDMALWFLGVLLFVSLFVVVRRRKFLALRMRREGAAFRGWNYQYPDPDGASFRFSGETPSGIPWQFIVYQPFATGTPAKWSLWKSHRGAIRGRLLIIPRPPKLAAAFDPKSRPGKLTLKLLFGDEPVRGTLGEIQGDGEFFRTYLVLADDGTNGAPLLSDEMRKAMEGWPEKRNPERMPVMVFDDAGLTIRLNDAVEDFEVIDRLLLLAEHLVEEVERIRADGL